MAAKTRIVYYDVLRTVAIFAVIAIHAFQSLGNGAQILHFPVNAFVESVGFAVPLFLMLSGALLLNREIELGSFIKHRLVRIVYPFIFFMIILLIVHFLKGNAISYNIFSYYWYFWLIIGVYLALPIINKFIQHASKKEIEYFLTVFVLSSIFYQMILYLGIEEQYFNLNFFVAPIGYLILGYYLSHYEIKMDSKKLAILMALIFIAVTIVKILSVANYIPPNLIVNYEAIQTKVLASWLDVSVFKIIQAGSLFLFFKHLTIGSEIVRKFTLSVSRASYGMYMLDLIFRVNLVSLIVGIPSSGTGICLCIIALTLVVFFGSWICVLVLSRIPGIKKVCGYY